MACGRPPVAGVDLEGGQQVNFCSDHVQQHEAMRLQKNREGGGVVGLPARFGWTVRHPR